MGVPVITLAGRSHVSRATASLLANVGRPEWVVSSEVQYIEKCIAVVSDLPRLAEERAAQRERVRQSPLCDAVRFVSQLEAGYRQMWRFYCSTAVQA